MVGGANSAGQAALYLAARGREVNLVIRGPDDLPEMSSYLVNRVLADPAIEVQTATKVTALQGGARLEQVSSPTDGASSESALWGVVLLHGRHPATEWLTGIATGDDGCHPDRRPADRTTTSGRSGPAWDGGRFRSRPAFPACSRSATSTPDR